METDLIERGRARLLSNSLHGQARSGPISYLSGISERDAGPGRRRARRAGYAAHTSGSTSLSVPTPGSVDSSPRPRSLGPACGSPGVGVLLITRWQDDTGRHPDPTRPPTPTGAGRSGHRAAPTPLNPTRTYCPTMIERAVARPGRGSLPGPAGRLTRERPARRLDPRPWTPALGAPALTQEPSCCHTSRCHPH